MNTPELLVGALAIGLGAGSMLVGYRLALVLLPVWGLFAGFLMGAQVEHALIGGGYLVTPVAWVVGGVLGLVFAVLSYLFWYIAVAIAFASVGSWLAWGGLTLVGSPEIGLATVALGLGVGAAVAGLGLVTGVPLVLVVIITAVGGAHALVAGVLLVLGTIDLAALEYGVVNAVIGAGIGWWLAVIGLSLIAITLQLRTIGDFALEPPAARLG
jgi:hypothetical protein